jgi:ribulose-bisphosphate carboxylase small chain
MHVTQGTFSYLGDLTDEQIQAQLAYALRQGWAIMLEHTDDPHPRNLLWDMWDQPRFDLSEDEAAIAMEDVTACRAANPERYVKIVCYDASLGRQTTALSFIVQRPREEAGFRLERTGLADRRLSYGLRRSAALAEGGRS